MNYEEKYKAALERARDLTTRQNPPAFDKDLISLVFPELAESEDERIRKDIMVLVKDWWDRVNKDNISTKEQMMAWLEKQREKPTIIDVDKMVREYSQTKNGDFGLPVNCMIKAYKKGINDTLKLSLNFEKQGEQKQTWKPNAAQLIVIKSLIEDKNTLNVSKVILRGMLDEFKQYFKL